MPFILFVPEGVPHIEFALNIIANGIPNVAVRDKWTGECPPSSSELEPQLSGFSQCHKDRLDQELDQIYYCEGTKYILPHPCKRRRCKPNICLNITKFDRIVCILFEEMREI